MNYKQFIEDLKLKILLAILLLLGTCNKPIDLSEIEIGSKAENYNLNSNLFTKKECLDYLYKIDNDSIYKRIQMIDKNTEEGATYYSYFLSDMAISKFRFGKFTPREGHVNVYNGNISAIDVSFPQEQLPEFVKYLYKTLGTPYTQEMETYQREYDYKPESYYAGLNTFEILEKTFPECMKDKNTIHCPVYLYWKKAEVYYRLETFFIPSPHSAQISNHLICMNKNTLSTPIKYDFEQVKIGSPEDSYPFEQNEDIQSQHHFAWDFYELTRCSYQKGDENIYTIDDIKPYKIGIKDNDDFSEYSLYPNKNEGYLFAGFEIERAKVIAYKNKIVAIYVKTHSNDFPKVYEYLCKRLGAPFFIKKVDIYKENYEPATLEALKKIFPEYVEVFHIDFEKEDPEYIETFGYEDKKLTAPEHILWKHDNVFCKFQVLGKPFVNKSGKFEINNSILFVIPKDTLNPHFLYQAKNNP